jgi:hypothetical protein
MVSYCLIVCVIACDGFYTPESRPARGVKIGNSIVIDNKTGNTIWAINGEEGMIQDLLQREIPPKTGFYRKTFELVVSLFAFAVAVSTILMTPVMS